MHALLTSQPRTCTCSRRAQQSARHVDKRRKGSSDKLNGDRFRPTLRHLLRARLGEAGLSSLICPSEPRSRPDRSPGYVNWSTMQRSKRTALLRRRRRGQNTGRIRYVGRHILYRLLIADALSRTPRRQCTVTRQKLPNGKSPEQYGSSTESDAQVSW
jgi:hypothetical protein